VSLVNEDNPTLDNQGYSGTTQNACSDVGAHRGDEALVRVSHTLVHGRRQTNQSFVSAEFWGSSWFEVVIHYDRSKDWW